MTCKKFDIIPQSCDRYAETHDLDLRHIEVVQFHLRAGCGRGSAAEPSRVLFQYSLNGGVQWSTGLTLALEKFTESRQGNTLKAST